MINNFYLIGCGLTLEALALYFAFWEKEFFLSPLLFLVTHILASFYFAKGMRPYFDKDHDKESRWFISLFILTVFLPVFGLLGIYVFLLLRYFRKNKKEVFHPEVYEDILLEYDEIEELIVENKTRQFSQILEIESVNEVLHGEDKDLRLGAINALHKMNERQTIDILNTSLDNTYQDIRYGAVEALNKISQEHMDKINILKSMVEIKPEDNMIRLTLADNYYEYAAKGLEEKTIENYYLSCAKDEYIKIVMEDQTEIRREDILKKLCDTYYLLADYDESINVAQEILALNKEDSWAILRIMESLFKQKDYASIRDWASKYVQNNDIHSEVRHAMEMWI